MDSSAPVAILDSVVTMDVDQSTPASTPAIVASDASELPPPTTTNVAQQNVDATAADD
ncbi:hypothetical protein C5167_044529 [Papaver somniferum]|uniref:Uncharacterized protein n=1 Tax=Papaver somniferum TaxID=3469 RepID=A0A4Y7L8T5_PAPSO|nr:hypothetical protein C5167_044529 [Papaver somniferum]